MHKNHYFKSNVLLKQFENDMDLFRSVVQEGLIHIPGYLVNLNTAFISANLTDIHKTAHKLKGGLLSMHAEIPAQTAQLIETAAEEGNIDQALSYKSRIESEIGETIEEMKQSIL